METKLAIDVNGKCEKPICVYIAMICFDCQIVYKEIKEEKRQFVVIWLLWEKFDVQMHNRHSNPCQLN